MIFGFCESGSTAAVHTGNVIFNAHYNSESDKH